MQGNGLNFVADWPRVLRVLHIAIIFVSIIVLAIFSARLVWLLSVGPSFVEEKISFDRKSSVASSVSTIDVSMLSRITPFRMQTLDPVGLEIASNQPDAPETELDITLNGVRADGNGSGVAFISTGGVNQTRYKVGDPISGLQNVVVESIFADGVLLSRDGRIERLSNFHGEDIGIKSLKDDGKKSIVQETPDREQAQADLEKLELAETTQDLDSAPEVITETYTMQRSELKDILSWARFDAASVGQDQGVVVFPLNSVVFAKSGLKTRDVVHAINGTQLNQDVDYEALIASLETAPDAEINLTRNGATMKLIVNVSE